MSIKLEGKDWECMNQCKSNCCSEIFLPLSPAQKTSFEKEGFWIADNNFTDYDWLNYHKALVIEKKDKGFRKISLQKDVSFEFIYNPYTNFEEIHILDKCSKLLPDGRCKVYRARPVICKKSLCIVFDIRKAITHYGEKGLLKDKVEAYRRGELKKW
jgi:Fe-S-cluster containining protein